MPIELPQDVYDAIDDASNRLSDAGITAKKTINEEKDESKEKNFTKKTKHPKQTLTASERARFTKIGEQLFLGALDKARQVKEAQEFQAKMNNVFQKLAHNSWDNAVQAFLNMKINAEKIYKAAKGKDFGPFSAIWKTFKAAWQVFRITMLAVKLAPILIPIIKSTLGAFLQPIINDLKALHETASDTSLGTFIKNMAESTGNFTDEVKNSLFGEIGGEILEWAKDRVKILVNSSKMVIENVMSFLKPALTMLADVLWLTIEGLTYGGPWGAAAGAIVGFVVGLIETVPDIVRKYQKNTRQHAIVSGQDKRIKQMEQEQQRLQQIITELEDKLEGTQNITERRKLMLEIEEKIQLEMKKQEELFELRKIKLMSENTITGKNKITGEDTIEMLKKMGLVEGKDFETIERDGKRIIKTLRGVEIAEGTGLMTIIKEVENVCNERLRVVLDDTKLRDMTTQEFLEIYEKYKSLSEEDREKYLPKSFLEAMKQIEKSDRAKAITEYSTAIILEQHRIAKTMEEQQQQINSERDSLQRREQEILAKMEAEHKKEEERLQKILEEIKNAVSANADTSFLNEMPSWISPLMEKMQSFMKTFDSPIMQILMGALSKLINETLEKFSSQKAEPDNNISKSVGTHSDQNTMLNIIRTQELSIEENPLGSEITGLKGKQEKLRLDGDTFSRQLYTDEVSSSITKVEPVVKTVERKETTGEQKPQKQPNETQAQEQHSKFNNNIQQVKEQAARESDTSKQLQNILRITNGETTLGFIQTVKQHNANTEEISKQLETLMASSDDEKAKSTLKSVKEEIRRLNLQTEKTLAIFHNNEDQKVKTTLMTASQQSQNTQRLVQQLEQHINNTQDENTKEILLTAKSQLEKSDALSTELLSTLNKRFTSDESFGNTQNGQTNEGKNPFELLAKNEHTETIKNTSTSTQNDTFGENGMTEEKAAEFKALTGNETLSPNENFPNENNVITPQKAELLKEALAQGKPLSNDQLQQLLTDFEKKTAARKDENTLPHTTMARVETHPAIKPQLRLGKFTVEDHYIIQRNEKETVVSNTESTINALTWCIPGTALNVNNDEENIIIIS